MYMKHEEQEIYSNRENKQSRYDKLFYVDCLAKQGMPITIIYGEKKVV